MAVGFPQPKQTQRPRLQVVVPGHMCPANATVLVGRLVPATPLPRRRRRVPCCGEDRQVSRLQCSRLQRSRRFFHRSPRRPCSELASGFDAGAPPFAAAVIHRRKGPDKCVRHSGSYMSRRDALRVTTAHEVRFAAGPLRRCARLPETMSGTTDVPIASIPF